MNVDAGLRWFRDDLYSSVSLFQNRISNYIERVETEEDIITIVNLTRGTIEGLEWEVATTALDGWRLFARGHWMKGTDSLGEPLADIPITQAVFGGKFSSHRWRSGIEFKRRTAKNRLGSGEKALEPAGLLSAFLGLKVGRGLEFTLSGRNLLNENYFVTADRKAPLAKGRSVGLTLNLLSD